LETLEILGKRLEIGEDGNLKNLSDWNEEIANELAKVEGIGELTNRHWVVINSPSIRKLTKQSGVNTKELYQLFPKGPTKKAARIAGLPKPKGCI